MARERREMHRRYKLEKEKEKKEQLFQSEEKVGEELDDAGEGSSEATASAKKKKKKKKKKSSKREEKKSVVDSSDQGTGPRPPKEGKEEGQDKEGQDSSDEGPLPLRLTLLVVSSLVGRIIGKGGKIIT